MTKLIDFTPEKIAAMVTPGVHALLEDAINKSIKDDYDKIVEEAGKKILSKLATYVESYRMLDRNTVVINLFINDRKIETKEV